MKVSRKPYKEPIEYKHFVWWANWFIARVTSTNDKTQLKMLADEVRNLIHDSGQRSTGYVSKEALKLKSHERCKEHFHSRLGVGKSLVRKIKSGKYHSYNLKRMYLEFFSACRVHSVTREENRRLIEIQNNPHTCNLPWRTQYKLAGISLVYTGPIYKIDGTKYIGWTETDLASMLGISHYKFKKLYSKEALQ